MRGLWVPVSGAIAQEKNVETIANNVANINTPGFKRDQLAFKEYLTILEKGADSIDLPQRDWRPEDFYRTQGAEHAQVKVDNSYTIHEQGQLTPTNNPFDVALQGPGMFEVLSPRGIRYTRQGSFSRDKDGFLVTSRGYPVLAANDDPQVLPEERKIKITGVPNINQRGEIFIGNQRIGQLSVREFKDLHQLQKEGQALFVNPDAHNLDSTSQTIVWQGQVEASNVNAISEIANLIKANRHFESIQRAIKAYDAMAGKGINEITKF